MPKTLVKSSFDFSCQRLTARDAGNASKTISRLCRPHAQQNPRLQGVAAAPRPSPCGPSTHRDAGTGVWKCMQDLLTPCPGSRTPQAHAPICDTPASTSTAPGLATADSNLSHAWTSPATKPCWQCWAHATALGMFSRKCVHSTKIKWDRNVPLP